MKTAVFGTRRNDKAIMAAANARAGAGLVNRVPAS